MSSRTIARTIAASSSASQPCTPGVMKLPTPPWLLATTGRPAHRASSAAMPKDSRSAGATYSPASAYAARISARDNRPGSSTQSRMACRSRKRSTGGRCGPSPISTARSGAPAGSAARTSRSIRASASGRFVRAKRITLKIVGGPAGSRRATRHRAGSTALGSTSTSTPAPRARRTGAAAASLTADHCTGQSARPVTAPPSAGSTPRGDQRECTVTRVGTSRDAARLAMPKANGENTETWACTTSAPASASRT